VAFDEAVPGFYDEPLGDEAPPQPVESSYERFVGSRFAVARPILIEAPFELSIGESAVSGRIDAVYEPEPGSWEIVAFKSGRPAYAVAASQAPLAGFESPNSIVVTFAYFGGDEVVAESETVDEPWLSAAADHLETLVSGAAAGPYEADPGEICRFCDFSRFCAAGTSWLENHQ
jgi:hypothetical protein